MSSVVKGLVTSVVTGIIVQALGFLFTHFAASWGIRPEAAAMIPGIADKVTGILIAAAMAFTAHQGLLGHGKDGASAAVKAALLLALEDFWPLIVKDLGLPAGTAIPSSVLAWFGDDSAAAPATPPNIAAPAEKLPGA